MEYILYPWGAIAHRVSDSISSFSHVLETAQILISCCMRYCWKSLDFRAKDLAFICERFSLNVSGMYSISLILLVLTSLPCTLYLWVVDTIIKREVDPIIFLVVVLLALLVTQVEVFLMMPYL